MRAAAGRASLATLVALLPHYLAFYIFGSPLWTETIAEWIMAHTPSRYALWILENLGPWAKPFAMTGGLALLGFTVLMVALARRRWMRVPAIAACGGLLGYLFGYHSWTGQFAFWLPALLVVEWSARTGASAAPVAGVSRREAVVMAAGTVFVAAEGFLRDEAMAGRAARPQKLAAFEAPKGDFAPALVRPPVTPVDKFYAMSKNTVDPALDARNWRLKITADGKVMRTVSYAELLSLPHVSEYVTLRCISNTLQSDLMGTALWTGVRLKQLVDAKSLPEGLVEAAVIGVDGHGDSFQPEYVFSDDVMLAVGMNGESLNRRHGFPVRMIVPRYYGFKNVKWIGEIAFVRKPYLGTWPKMGYTKDPVVHTASHIDRVIREGGELRAGGVSFAGDRGIQAVQVRADGGRWMDAVLDRPLSRFTWTRWHAAIPGERAQQVEARALDGAGLWQATDEGPLFPNGIQGPTIRRVS